MKILLFGEFSGLHTNLQSGLKEIGHDVTLVSTRDSYKKIEGDIILKQVFKNKYLNYTWNFMQFWRLLFFIKKYDIVQLISYDFLKMPYFFKLQYIKALKRRNKFVILNKSGLDAYGISVLLGNLRYSPFQNELKEEVYDGVCKLLGYKHLLKSKKIAMLFSGIITNMYEYHLPYHKFNNYLGAVPLPLHTEQNLKENTINGKIKILYGILRKTLKGHSYIMPALKKIEEDYSEKVEIKIVEKLSLKEYKKELKNCNLLIDQACCYSYGMNALYAGSMAKVVLTGNEAESEDFFGRKAPFVNILPNTDDIYKKIEFFIQNPNKIKEIGDETKVYVQDFHNHKKVATEYIKLYEKLNK